MRSITATPERWLAAALALLAGLALAGCAKQPTRADLGGGPALGNAVGSRVRASRSSAPASGAHRSPRAVADAFFEQMAARKYDAAFGLFGPKMARAMDTKKLARAWQRLLERAGAYRRIERVRTRDVRGYKLIIYRCRFARRQVDVQLTMNSQSEVSGLFYRPVHDAEKRSPPPYADRKIFDERDVEVGQAPFLLPGTLSLPKIAKAAARARGLPAVVLVHGSGPHDRDETIGPNKPFRDIAWGLASRGIVVLRYDKRTKIYAGVITKDLEKLTVKEETIDDAVHGAALLRTIAGVDAKRVFMLGHSLGGNLLPRIAKADGKLAGLIFMAANSRPLARLILEQFTYLAKLDGSINAHERKRLQMIAAKVARLERWITKKGITKTPSRLELPLNLTAGYWLDLEAHPPLPAVKRLKQPMLFLQGKRDYQVTRVDLAGWKKALAGRRNVTYRLYPHANHLLIDGKGTPRPTEYKRPAYVTKAAIEDIARFIKKHEK